MELETLQAKQQAATRSLTRNEDALGDLILLHGIDSPVTARAHAVLFESKRIHSEMTAAVIDEELRIERETRQRTIGPKLMADADRVLSDIEALKSKEAKLLSQAEVIATSIIAEFGEPTISGVIKFSGLMKATTLPHRLRFWATEQRGSFAERLARFKRITK